MESTTATRTMNQAKPNNLRKHILLLFSLMVLTTLWTIEAFSQVDFTTTPASGCRPLGVTFEAAQLGLRYHWVFGNNTSATTDSFLVAAAYTNAGIYTASLSVSSDGGATWSTPKTKTITVFELPTASFTTSATKGCTPLSVDFVAPTGFSEYHWDMAGTPYTSQSPTHTFSQEATYDVKLYVVDSHGCKSDAKTTTVDVANPPVAAFTINPQNSCDLSVPINFLNTSWGTGLTETSYQWVFEHTTPTGANSSNPGSRTYSNIGKHLVTLTATSSYGCSKTVTDTVKIFKIEAAGTITQDGKTINNDDYVCADVPIILTNQTTGVAYCEWDFGDGYEINPSHVYTTAGPKTVKLRATGSNCSSTATWTFNVETVNADFSSTTDQACTSPVENIKFKSTSTSSAAITTYEWHFYDNSTSSIDSVLKTLTIPADEDPYVIHQSDIKLINSLTVTSTHGCVRIMAKDFSILRPTALFEVDTAMGCVGRKVNFKSESKSGYASQTPPLISSYYWDFGDGTDTTTATISSSHTYNTAGIHQARLIITNNLGCKDTSYYIPIRIGNAPNPAFSLSSASVCPSESVTITNNTTGSNIDDWCLTINGKPVNACWNEIPSDFRVKSADVGTLSIKLIAGSNGCYNSTSGTNLVNKGPKSSFSYNIGDCNSSRTYTFNGTTTGSLVTWEYGDGSGASSTHTYSATKDSNYTAKFITSQNSCTDTVIQTVRVRMANAQFTMPPKGCAGQAISFNGDGSHNKTDFCQDRFIWDFKDATPLIRTDQNALDHTFATRGWYKVLMTAIYDNGCTDTTAHSIRIYQPYSVLQADTTRGCSGLTVTFTDTLSQPDYNALEKFRISYGDGQKDSASNKNETFSHEYTSTFTIAYPAVLTVVDTMKCTNTDTLNIGIGAPDASFAAISSSKICANDVIQFQVVYPANIDSAIWDFGDGLKVSSTEDTISHKYTDGGLFEYKDFNVTRTVYEYTCPGTFTTPVQVLKPDASFTLNKDSVLDCPPQGIIFTHTNHALMKTSGLFASGQWSVGWPEKQYPYQDSIIYTYERAGEDTVHLTIVTKNPTCKATFSRVVKIKGPVGYYSINPKNACKGDEVTFSAYGLKDVSNFEWFFSDGSRSTDTVHKHRFMDNSIGTQTATLILKNSTCPQGSSFKDSVYISRVLAKFSVTDTSVCEQVPVSFTNLSEFTGSLHLYYWDFGDGTTESVSDPVHAFGLGAHPVMLTITDSTGCKDTTVRVMTVQPNPPVSVSKDTSRCADNVMLLHATGGDSIVWYPGIGLSDSSSYTPEARPGHTTYYKAKVIYNNTGCFTIDSILVSRAHVNLHPQDTTVVIGNDVPILFADSSYVASFRWAPNTYLSCTNCLNPIASPSANVIYNLILTEPGRCFVDTIPVNIKVDWTNLTFDLPSAFKPGTNDNNSYVMVKGRGIRELLEFKIYNRWGNVVFSTNDRESRGWDGKYQGKDQPIDTYVWTAVVKTYDDKIIKKKGTVLLLR